MNSFHMGVMVDSLRLSLQEGIKKSRQIGAEGIQINAAQGGMSPENLTPVQRREAGIWGDMGSQGLKITYGK